MIVPGIDDARDRELVRKLAAGDQDAFRQLFRLYAPLAKGLAARLVRQAFMAEEIVQEAFLALWSNPHGYQEERGTFRTWLLSTVHHRAVDAVRREESQRRRIERWEPGETEEADVSDSVVAEFSAIETRGAVRSAMAQIPAEQREVLEMMYFHGRSQSAIAEELDLPLGTVKSRTLLGMRRLRGMLLEKRE